MFAEMHDYVQILVGHDVGRLVRNKVGPFGPGACGILKFG